MGFESFNAEPVVPDESERVDDVEKAQVMAQAEGPLRDYAAQFDRAQDTPIDDTGRLKMVKINDGPGEYSSRGHLSKNEDGSITEYAGSRYQGFDKNMSDEEIRVELSKQSEDAKKEAENAGDLAGEQFEKQKEGNQ